jgi:hypothetical protein
VCSNEKLNFEGKGIKGMKVLEIEGISLTIQEL